MTAAEIEQQIKQEAEAFMAAVRANYGEAPTTEQWIRSLVEGYAALAVRMGMKLGRP